MKRLILSAAAALMILGASEAAFAGGPVYVYTSRGWRRGRARRVYYSETYYYPRRHSYRIYPRRRYRWYRRARRWVYRRYRRPRVRYYYRYGY